MPYLNEDIDLLSSTRSTQRRSAAKRLRKTADISAGPSLLTALMKEVKDSRTWETQYQMVMALGECRYTDAIPFLRDMAASIIEATSIYTALGDALVRLQIQSPTDGQPIVAMFETKNASLIDGAFRAMAMLRMVPQDNHLNAIIDHAEQLPRDDYSRFWILAACPGWSGERIKKFVEHSAHSLNDEIKDAADCASNQKYQKWNPL